MKTGAKTAIIVTTLFLSSVDIAYASNGTESDNFLGLEDGFFDGLFVCVAVVMIVIILYSIWKIMNPTLEERWKISRESEWE